MNKLPIAKKVDIINMFVKGMSLRAISKIADVSINTVVKLLIDTGKSCQSFHDEIINQLNVKSIEANETWSFVYSNVKSTANIKTVKDVWTWTAIDTDSKLIISYFVGERDADVAYAFMYEVESRLNNRVQLTTDGHKAYLNAVPDALRSQIDYDILIKFYGEPQSVNGLNSHVQRLKTSKGLHIDSFTYLASTFSKKMESHCYALAVHFVYYNFAKIHKTLNITPAMAAGLCKRVFTIEEIAGFVD